MKVVIVDDEARNRSTLKALCKEYCPNVDVVGEASSVGEASVLLKSLEPDFIFLDIVMPEENGFTLLEAYNNAPPFEVIFTTAHEKFALQAFDSSAIGYLLKPINIDELINVVDKVAQLLPVNNNPQRTDRLKQNLEDIYNQKIALTTSDGLTFVKYSNIVRCEAEGNYTQVFFHDGSSLLLTRTLKQYEDIFLEHNFFRVHKSHLINLQYVRKFIKGRQCMLEMIDGQKVEVSNRKREALLARLEA